MSVQLFWQEVLWFIAGFYGGVVRGCYGYVGEVVVVSCRSAGQHNMVWVLLTSGLRPASASVCFRRIWVSLLKIFYP
eukprot:scaffold213055_cov73-Cyclotella_meneghiniana.AAC.1